LVAFLAFICLHDYNLSSLKFLHTAQITLHASTTYEVYDLVDALSLFSKIPQLSILWLQVIMGEICHGRLRSATSGKPLQTLTQGREGLGHVKSSLGTR
jgi:hypothetical protein